MHDYLEILPKGKENAIKGEELAKMLGFHDVRGLRSDISRCRAEGQVICSSTTHGYFLPASEEELEKFIGSLSSMALNTLKAIKGAKKELKKMKIKNSGQISFNDLGEEDAKKDNANEGD